MWDFQIDDWWCCDWPGDEKSLQDVYKWMEHFLWTISAHYFSICCHWKDWLHTAEEEEIQTVMVAEHSPPSPQPICFFLATRSHCTQAIRVQASETRKVEGCFLKKHTLWQQYCNSWNDFYYTALHFVATFLLWSLLWAASSLFRRLQLWDWASSPRTVYKLSIWTTHATSPKHAAVVPATPDKSPVLLVHIWNHETPSTDATVHFLVLNRNTFQWQPWQ